MNHYDTKTILDYLIVDMCPSLAHRGYRELSLDIPLEKILIKDLQENPAYITGYILTQDNGIFTVWTETAWKNSHERLAITRHRSALERQIRLLVEERRAIVHNIIVNRMEKKGFSVHQIDQMLRLVKELGGYGSINLIRLGLTQEWLSVVENNESITKVMAFQELSIKELESTLEWLQELIKQDKPQPQTL